MGKAAKETFLKVLGELLSDGKVSDSELARRVGRTPTTVRRWRLGIQEPSFADLDKIAAALGVPVGLLVGDPSDFMTRRAALKVLSDVVDEAERIRPEPPKSH